MAQTVRIKQGDLFPDVVTIVEDENGDVIDLTGCTVKFSMRPSRAPATLKVDQADGVLVDGTGGEISYVWAAGDTDTPGTYEGEFLVNPVSGDDFRVPTDGYITVIVEDKVA